MMTVPNPHPPHSPTLATQLQGPLGTFLEHRVLPGWIRERRWFRSKSRTLRTVTLEALFPCDAGGTGDAVIAIVRIGFGPQSRQDPDVERYLVPLALVAAEAVHGEGAEQTEDAKDAQARTRPLPDAAVLGPVATPAGTRLLIDGCWHEGFRTALHALLADHETLEGFGGGMRGHPLPAPLVPGAPAAREQASGKEALRAATTTSRVLSAEQSNTSLVYGSGSGAVFVKLYRRIEDGIHPEPEMLRALSAHTTFRNAPGFRSSLEWTNPEGRAFTVALAQEFWENAADAWEFMLDGLKRAQDGRLPTALRETAVLLGQRVAEFHKAAASVSGADFSPQAFTRDDAREAGDRARASLAAGLRDMERRLKAAEKPDGNGPAAAAFPIADARALLAERRRIEARIAHAVRTFETAGDAGLKIRTHGDLHLGQILILRRADARRDAGLLDFEGEPGRPLAAARRLQSPLRDVAGMLRSFHYASHAAVRSGQADASLDPERVFRELQDTFLDSYFSTLDGGAQTSPASDTGTAVLPAGADTRRALLDVFLLEKAAYELAYECDNRPDWAGIPVQGLLSLTSAPDPVPPAPSS